ncbi:putative Zn finger protein [Rhodococcus sp. 27YEA15]|uniref:hypothetical protein n=1 Tax=Rhodococcus sp. 27YEA15 TaxID=3156259 RepID=UPI003C7AD2C7
MADEFGVTAWGRAWLRTIEKTAAIGPNPALPTARGLARSGAVTFGEISTGTVAAEVTAKGRTSTVHIAVPRWSASDVDGVRELLHTDEAASRTAITGELADGIVTELNSRGIAVAVDLVECVSTCTCTSRRTPCTHQLATVYALVGRIDEEPALALTLRSTKPTSPTASEPEWIPLCEIDVEAFYEN